MLYIVAHILGDMGVTRLRVVSQNGEHGTHVVRCMKGVGDGGQFGLYKGNTQSMIFAFASCKICETEPMIKRRLYKGRLVEEDVKCNE